MRIAVVTLIAEAWLAGVGWSVTGVSFARVAGTALVSDLMMYSQTLFEMGNEMVYIVNTYDH